MIANCIESTVKSRELIILDAFRIIESELRLIDPVCFAIFLTFGQMSSVFDQVVEIVDRHFCKGSMNFACTGDVAISWKRHPIVVLDFEFSHSDICAFFRLIMGCGEPQIELHHISFQNSTNDTDGNSRLLVESLKAARSRVGSG